MFDTIAAIASAAGGAVGLIRMSGPAAIPIARRHFPSLPAEMVPRHLVHGWWVGADGAPLDECLLAVMPGPASYTGEDVVEIYAHGGALNLERCLEVCVRAGARAARPGEFTQRAFLNDRMDLTRAEAVADLIAARTDQALALAREQLRGGLAALALELREALLGLRARLEVNLDFVEEDVPIFAPESLAAEARGLASRVAAVLGSYTRGRLVREGARVALVGPPNVGKSSLFNALCASDRAIVTPIPGTTRDTLTEIVDILGIPVTLVDTAGLRAEGEGDEVERLGMARTRQAAATADLLLGLADGSLPAPIPAQALAPTPVLCVRTKADLPVHPDHGGSWIAVSARSGEGIDDLRRAIARALGLADGGGSEIALSRARHKASFETLQSSLHAAAAGLEAGLEAELVAIDLQEGLDALAELTGVSTPEDVLDRLFASFCIGK
jgi:tRNA modification GTPase